MRSSRLVAMMAVILVFGFTLPTLCFAFVSSGATAIGAAMPGGCHGEKNPMPTPRHSCCYASHEVPQPVQTTTTLTPQNQVTEIIEMPVTESRANSSMEVEPPDTSPIKSAVLRI